MRSIAESGPPAARFFISKSAMRWNARWRAIAKTCAVQLAHHFSAAGTAEAVDKAIKYARRAGEGALGSLAYEDAYSYFDMALDLIDRSHVGIDEATRTDVLFDRARSLFASGERASAKSDFEVVASVYRELNDPDRLTKFALGISGTSMRHLWTEYGTVSEWLIELMHEALAFSDGTETSGRVRLLARLAEELYFSPDAETRSAIADLALDDGEASRRRPCACRCPERQAEGALASGELRGTPAYGTRAFRARGTDRRRRACDGR